MHWVWELYEDYTRKELRRRGVESPTQEQLQQTFIQLLSESTVTVLVQEPWQNAVRFKGLARYTIEGMMPLLRDPEAFLLEHFGGGKFKLNFHHGMNFVATINFKPEGEPRWQHLPDIGY